MKKSIVFLMLLMSLCNYSNSQTFFNQQLKYSRFKSAYQNCEKDISVLFENQKIQKSTLQILFRAFKNEKTLEVWAKNNLESKYHLLKTYSICASSGTLGPKLKQGDGQVPEGIYHIDRFNPTSSYHLSLGINYPNSADLKRNSDKPGGDIFIHGYCVTIGCLPMTNSKMEEIYSLAVLAKTAGQSKIPVLILPSKKIPASTSIYVEFWKQLFAINEYFELNRKLPNYSVNSKGQYVLKS